MSRISTSLEIGQLRTKAAVESDRERDTDISSDHSDQPVTCVENVTSSGAGDELALNDHSSSIMNSEELHPDSLPSAVGESRSSSSDDERFSCHSSSNKESTGEEVRQNLCYKRKPKKRNILGNHNIRSRRIGDPLLAEMIKLKKISKHQEVNLKTNEMEIKTLKDKIDYLIKLLTVMSVVVVVVTLVVFAVLHTTQWQSVDTKEAKKEIMPGDIVQTRQISRATEVKMSPLDVEDCVDAGSFRKESANSISILANQSVTKVNWTLIYLA